MRRFGIATLAITTITLLAVSPAFADLMLVGPVVLHGTGFGHETIILTTQITGKLTQTKHNPNLDEYGCDMWNGSAVAFGGCAGTGDISRDEKGPAHFPHNDTPLLSANGITDASQIEIIFDPNQPGPDHGITMNNLVITIWDPNGTLVWNSGDLLNRPIVFPTTDPGQGKSGFGFVLTQAQVNSLNAVLDSDDRIGLSSHLSGAKGGPDDYFLRSAAPPVPEPASLLLLGTGLLAAGSALRRTNRKRK